MARNFTSSSIVIQPGLICVIRKSLIKDCFSTHNKLLPPVGGWFTGSLIFSTNSPTQNTVKHLSSFPNYTAGTSTITPVFNTAHHVFQWPAMPHQKTLSGKNPSSPAKLKLTNFNVRLMEDNSIYLYWETAGNSTSEFFIVERSTDLLTWQGLKTIGRSGNTLSPLQYFYVDAHLPAGRFYYRLKEVNTTGSSAYSNIVSAEISSGNTDIYVTEPVSTGDQLFIGGITNTKEWDVSVLSTSASLTLKPAILNSNILKIPEQHSGVYLLKLQNRVDGRIKTIRFLKK